MELSSILAPDVETDTANCRQTRQPRAREEAGSPISEPLRTERSRQRENTERSSDSGRVDMEEGGKGVLRFAA